jgi:hypothetical protein
MPQEAIIYLKVYDSKKALIPPDMNVLIRLVVQGHEKWSEFCKGPSYKFPREFNNRPDWDTYSVIVSAKGFRDSASRITVDPKEPQTVNLMLVPKDAQFDFSGALWGLLQTNFPKHFKLLGAGAASPAEAERRYKDLMENHPKSLAAFFNIATAMDQISFGTGNPTPLDYMNRLIWTDIDNNIKQDRFFGYADKRIIDPIKTLEREGFFKPEIGSGVFHSDPIHGPATRSWKQRQFTMANVQLTLHEEDHPTFDGIECVQIEPDIDYFDDLVAHGIFEVLPNTALKNKTDPVNVYSLRWVAGMQAGIEEFAPPFVIV